MEFSRLIRDGETMRHRLLRQTAAAINDAPSVDMAIDMAFLSLRKLYPDSVAVAMGLFEEPAPLTAQGRAWARCLERAHVRTETSNAQLDVELNLLLTGGGATRGVALTPGTSFESVLRNVARKPAMFSYNVPGGTRAFADWAAAARLIEPDLVDCATEQSCHAWTSLLRTEGEVLGFLVFVWKSPALSGKSKLAEAAVLSNFVETVCDAVNHWHRHNVALAKEHGDLQLQLQRKFLDNLSHEMKTPLNAVIGFSQLISEDLSISPQIREYVESSLSGADSLLSIIDQARVDWRNERLCLAC